jgi:hypothetical protein
MIRYSKEWWREYRLKNGDRLRAYKRKYDSQRYKLYKDHELARRRAWDVRNPDKAKAHRALNYAIRQGKVEKLGCLVCGNPKSHAHHEDYDKPLQVIWLCALHHSAHHVRDREYKSLFNL